MKNHTTYVELIEPHMFSSFVKHMTAQQIMRNSIVLDVIREKRKRKWALSKHI